MLMCMLQCLYKIEFISHMYIFRFCRSGLMIICILHVFKILNKYMKISQKRFKELKKSSL